MLRFLLVPLLMLSACSASPVGEVGYANCTNSRDDDHDGLTDCADPDCLSIDRCGRIEHALPTTDAGGKVGSGGTDGPPHWLPTLDAGQLEEDGGFADEDAGADEPPLLCDPPCPATHACMNGDCMAVATNMPVKFRLTITSVVAANMGPYAPPPLGYPCLDEFAQFTDDLAGCYPRFCTLCIIDPYVVVYRVHKNGDEQLIGMTEVVEDSTEPQFKAAPMEGELEQGDSLKFEVKDSNVSAADKTLFSCKPDLQELVSGPIDCAAEESTPRRPLEVKAVIEPIASD